MRPFLQPRPCAARRAKMELYRHFNCEWSGYRGWLGTAGESIGVGALVLEKGEVDTFEFAEPAFCLGNLASGDGTAWRADGRVQRG